MGSSIELVEDPQSLESSEELQKKLFLIESDHYLSQAFVMNGSQPQYQTSTALAGKKLSEEQQDYIIKNRPNMILLDLGFADNAKLQIIRDIRTVFDGLLVVVSSKSSEQEQIEALKFGADDYLLKPFDSRILMLRIEALFRRQVHPSKQIDLASMTTGDICLMPKSQKCLINGEGVKLTTFEFNLLKSLIEHQGNILSRDKLYQTLLRRAYNGVERTLDVRMSQLREKLTAAGMKNGQIETVWGQGYMFNQVNSQTN